MSRRTSARETQAGSTVDHALLVRRAFGPFLVLSSDFVVLEASDAYLAATGTRRESLIGRSILEIPPGGRSNPGGADADELRRSLERVRSEGIADRAGAGVEDRYRGRTNVPVFGPDGELRYIVHRLGDAAHVPSPSGATEEAGLARTATPPRTGAEPPAGTHRPLAATEIPLSEPADRPDAPERRGAGILRSITYATLHLDREWRFSFVNREAERLLRRTRGELLGRTLWEAFPEARESLSLKRYRNALARGRPIQFEGFYPPLNLWVSARAFPTPLGVSIYLLDTTERKREEEEKALLQALALRIGEAEDLPSALDSMLLEVCRATRWTAGEVWAPDARGTMLYLQAYSPPLREEIRAFHEEGARHAVSAGEGLIGEAWQTGRAIWSTNLVRRVAIRRKRYAARAGFRAGTAVPVFGGDEVVAVMVFFHTESRREDSRMTRTLGRVGAQLRNVIERRRVDSAVRALNQQLAERDRLLAIAGRIARIGGWTVDLEDRIVRWSDEVCAILEVPPGTTVTVEEGLDYYAPEWRPVIEQHFQACVERGTPFDLELEIISARGRRLAVRTLGEAVRGLDGRVVRVQGAFQDLTPPRRAEAEERESEQR